jgi:two-component system nitrogen regulation response regulator GlnG
MSHVLIVDDEESICWGLSRLLTETGHEVSVAPSAEEALDTIGRHTPDLVVLDVRLPGMDGLSAMPRLRELTGDIPIIVITAFGNLEIAVGAIQRGAFNYLAKPFDLEHAGVVIDRALAQRKRTAVQPTRQTAPLQELLGASPAMQEVFKRIALVAPSDASVLITGESGTGKELVARAIHRHSNRRGKAFVPIHLASLSPTLIESELFGHVRGAFTGAESSRQGLLQLADDATVFFDEAGDIPLSLQIKLLRVLEQQEVTPVGSTQSHRIAFRVIAATNRNLHALGEGSTLRRDLYFRLAGFEISLPPLRERVEDIPLLAEHFLRQAERSKHSSSRFSAAALRELCRRSWPGNVRQLRHAVEHGALLARGGDIDVEHLPADVDSAAPASTDDELQACVRTWAQQRLSQGPLEGGLYQAFLSHVEPSLFDAVLHSTAGNRAAAADALGIHRATLRKKLGTNGESR